MKTSEETIDVLNDLIEINNDRTAGFEKATEALEQQDSDLQAIFTRFAGESRNNSQDLTAMVAQLGGEATTGTSLAGSMHRAWLNVESLFTGKDRATILAECERGEDSIKKSYQDALADEEGLDEDVTALLNEQLSAIIVGHDTIKSMRDSAKSDEDRDDYETRKQDNSSITETAPGTFGANGDSSVVEEENWNDEATALPDNNTIIAEDETDPQFSFEKQRQEQSYQTQEMQENANDNTEAVEDSKLAEFFLDQLKDLLWAEKELVDTLPKMAEAATSNELRDAFNSHLSETEQHVSRLEQIFDLLGEDPDTEKCDAMAGIIEEGEDIIDETEEGTAQRDVGLVFAGQKVEHYEIASYGGMVTLAKTLGYTDAASILSQTLEEEKAADGKLTDIAENNINYQASRES